MLKEALFYESLPDKKIHCRLCPQECVRRDGEIGFCGVRTNKDGRLYSDVYEKITSLALDPIEKKPLYHYHSGEFILSVGTKGCNFHCGFCQNWQISQEASTPTERMTSQEIVEKAKKSGSFGIAYTYNEPFIWYEFILDTATLAKKEGLENVLVTNGYVNEEPLRKLLPLINAMNIDVKSMDPGFYKKICKGRLEPVLKTAEIAKKNCHVEITNPTWIKDKLGADVPLHFSRYFPCHEYTIPSTPVSTLKLAEKIARKKLKYVYLGNV